MFLKRYLVLFTVFCACFVGVFRSAHGHVIDQVYAEIETEGNAFHVALVIDAAYCLPQFRGDDKLDAPDMEWIYSFDEAGHTRLRAEAEAYLRETLVFLQQDVELEYAISFPDYAQTPYKFYGSMFGVPTLRVALQGQFLPRGGELSASWQDPYEATLLFVVKKYTGERRENISVPLSPGTKKELGIHVEAFELSALSEETVAGQQQGSDPVVTITTNQMSWLGFVKIGFDHVVPYGLDHILFVVGLFLFSPLWRPLLHQSLAFTVAHSVTLALSLIGVVGFSGKWVEALIALSIVYVAVENLRAKDGQKVGWHRLILVFAFGLLHGLGFGSMLRSYLPNEDLLWPIVGFNVGVELGQLAVLAVCFLLFAWFAKNFRWIRIIGSTLICLIGMFWVFERAFS